MVRELGLDWFRFDWIVRQDAVIYTLVIAAVWHAAGLVMVIMLAGLRGIDEDIWKAARIDGLPPWRVYLSIVIPMLGASFATASVLLATSVVRLYDLSVAMTNGGPGMASEVPAKFVMDHLFERGNLGLATAAATSMLITVAAVVVPFLYWQSRRRGGRPA
jgi:glucose/mannose transport system permease protein